MIWEKHYINTKNGSKKWYKITTYAADGIVQATWGSIGHSAIGRKMYDVADINDLIKTKKKKGYIEVPIEFSKSNAFWNNNPEMIEALLSKVISATGYMKILDSIIDNVHEWAEENTSAEGEANYLRQANVLQTAINELKPILGMSV